MQMFAPNTVALFSAAIFAAAVLHTFSTRSIERFAHGDANHSGLWRLLSEVEVVFGFWAAILDRRTGQQACKQSCLQFDNPPRSPASLPT